MGMSFNLSFFYLVTNNCIIEPTFILVQLLASNEKVDKHLMNH